MVPCLAMSTVLRLFSPTNRSFYNLLNETSGITLQMSELLYKAVLTGSTNESKNYFHRIATLRDKSSELRKKIYGVASRSLIAPFDRSDMLTLSTAIHTVGKSVDTAAKRINHIIYPQTYPGRINLFGGNAVFLQIRGYNFSINRLLRPYLGRHIVGVFTSRKTSAQ